MEGSRPVIQPKQLGNLGEFQEMGIRLDDGFIVEQKGPFQGREVEDEGDGQYPEKAPPKGRWFHGRGILASLTTQIQSKIM